MSTAIAVMLFVGVTAYALFGGADFGAGFWDLVAGGAERGERPRRGHRSLDRTGVGSKPCVADLLFRRLWTGFAEAYASITLTLFVPLAIAVFGIVLRGSSFGFRKTVFRTRDRRNFGAAFASSSVLVPYCLAPSPVRSHQVECRQPARRVTRGRVRSIRRRSSVVCWRWRCGPISWRCTWCTTWCVSTTRPWRSTSAAGPSARLSWRVLIAAVGVFVLRSDAKYLFGGATTKALPFVVLSALCGSGHWSCCCATPPTALASWRWVRWPAWWSVGRRPMAVHPSREPEGGHAAAPTPTLNTLLVVGIAAVLIVVPGFILLYTLDQRSLLPEEGVD